MPKHTTKLILLVIGIIIFIILFYLSFNMYRNEAENRSVFIESAPQGKTDFIEVSAHIVTIDPIKGETLVRLSFEPKGSLANDKGMLNEEVDMFVNSSAGKQDYSFAKDKIMNPVDVNLKLYDGLVTDYPFDKHEAELVITTSGKVKKESNIEGEKNKENEEEIVIDNAVSFLGSIPGYQIDAGLDKDSKESNTVLDISINRAGSVRFFAYFVMIIMWCLILMLLFMLYSVLVNGRKVEIGMFSFSSSLLFAFPAFRNMMPLSPPIGAFPDYAAFFWAEGTAALTLILLISTWLLRKQS